MFSSRHFAGYTAMHTKLELLISQIYNEIFGQDFCSKKNTLAFKPQRCTAMHLYVGR